MLVGFGAAIFSLPECVFYVFVVVDHPIRICSENDSLCRDAFALTKTGGQVEFSFSHLFVAIFEVLGFRDPCVANKLAK